MSEHYVNAPGGKAPWEGNSFHSIISTFENGKYVVVWNRVIEEFQLFFWTKDECPMSYKYQNSLNSPKAAGSENV